MSTPEPKDFLNKLFQAAFDAANPDLCVPANLPPPPTGRGPFGGPFGGSGFSLDGCSPPGGAGSSSLKIIPCPVSRA